MAFDIKPPRSVTPPLDRSSRDAVVLALEQSGESLSSFSRKHGIALSTLHSWRRKYRSSATKIPKVVLPSFVEVRPLIDSESPASGLPTTPARQPGQAPAYLRLDFGDGLSLRFSPSDSPMAIAAFVRGFMEAY